MISLRELAARAAHPRGVPRTVNGRAYRLDPRERAVAATFDEVFTAAIRATLRPGDRAWNIGAHIGLHALELCSAVGPAGHVAVVEPNPHTRAILERNLRLNGCRATVGAFAVGGAAGETVLHLDGASPMSRAGSPNPLLPRTRQVTVPVRTLDDMLAEYGMPRLVLVDIEGWEVAALRGASHLLASPDRPLLLVEMHGEEAWSWSGHSRADLEAILAAHGLSMETLAAIPGGPVTHVAIR